MKTANKWTETLKFYTVNEQMSSEIRLLTVCKLSNIIPDPSELIEEKSEKSMLRE